MKTTPFYRRRPLLSSLLLLLVTIIVSLAVLLSQLDLVRFRHHLTAELSRILQQPVGIGKLNLTYQEGLAIEVHNLGIGDEKNLDVRIPLLTAVLRLKPLLDGEFLLDRVILTEPQIKLAISGNNNIFHQQAAPSKTGVLFDTFGMSLLTIRRAQLFLEATDSAQSKLPSQIDNLNLVLRDWGTGKSGALVVSGELPDQKSKFTIESELPPPAKLANWRQQNLALKAELTEVPGNLLPDRLQQTLSEHFDASIQIGGALDQGASVKISVKNSLNGQPLLKASCRWTSQAQSDQLEQLHLILDGLPLEGRLLLDRTAAVPRLQGTLSARDLQLRRLLDATEIRNPDKLTSGTVRTAEITFNGTLSNTVPPGAQQFQYQVKTVLENGRWELTDTHQLENIALNIELDEQNIRLISGRAQMMGQSLSFDGAIHNWRDEPLFTLNAATSSDISTLVNSSRQNLPEALSLNGTVPTTIRLEGNRELVRGEIDLNLDQLEGHYRSLLNKQSGQAARLSMTGNWQPGQLQIDQAKLNIEGTEIEGKLYVPLAGTKRPLQIELNAVNLTALQPLSPLLQRIEATGLLYLDLLHWDTGNFQGNLYLENTGAHLTHLISDIKAANGSISFDHQGLDFAGLTARLGRSPVQLDGRLRNWRNFLLDLRIRGTVVRARDLVFANEKILIHDLDGHLLINRGGIIFDPITLKLENGTDATVQGYVRNFADPDTYLEIESTGYADILSIIQLFRGPPKATPVKRTRKPKPINIQARVAKGSLGGLNFQQAEGTIVSRRGLFTLSPLRFMHEEGYCLARVELEQGLLKVSGHLENFDASVLHNETLKTRGLINGTLRGDFYLEGTGTGDTFWASSMGGAHLEVQDGVLRKFRGLAQIFSLLNVSQLLTLQLPDMDNEGMPFSQLTMNARLDKGVLSTTNTQIVSNAMNMSLIGKRDIVNDTVNLTVGVKPLRTVDKIITAIPVAGWLLAGEERALLTAHFRVKGPASNPKVTAVPVSSLSKTIIGLLQRTLGLPGTVITEPEKLFPDPQGTIPPDSEEDAQSPEKSVGAGDEQ